MSTRRHILCQKASGGGGAIKSIQQGTATIAVNQTSKAVTITSVDTTQSILLFLGWTSTKDVAAEGSKVLPRIALTNATTVTAYRNTADASYTVTAGYAVLEFTGALKSVQAGTVSIALNDTSGTATITSVDTTKANVIFLGFTDNDPFSYLLFPAYTFPRIALTNATTVTAYRNTGGASIETIGFMVAEWL